MGSLWKIKGTNWKAFCGFEGPVTLFLYLRCCHISQMRVLIDRKPKQKDAPLMVNVIGMYILKSPVFFSLVVGMLNTVDGLPPEVAEQ